MDLLKKQLLKQNKNRHKTPQDNGLPFFSKAVSYPHDMFDNMSSKTDILNFFFDENTFTQIITKAIKKNKNTKEPDVNEIVNHNIMFMMYMLFPTVIPFSQNIYSSYERFILQNPKTINVGWVLSTYSYLILRGKKYTITKSVWLNDIHNNPTYHELGTNILENINPQNVFKLIKGNSSNKTLDKLIAEYFTPEKPNERKGCDLKDLFLSFYKDFKYNFINSKDEKPKQGCFDETTKNTPVYCGIDYINKTDTNKPQYETFISLDLVDGQIDPSNEKTVLCNFKSKFLSKNVMSLPNKTNYDVEQNRINVSLAELLAKNGETETKTEPEPETETEMKNGQNVRFGKKRGGRKTRKIKKNTKSRNNTYRKKKRHNP